MSGIKPWNLTLFYRRLHRRRQDAGTLAEAIASGRTHVTEVLNGTTDSPRTRRRLAALLKPRELELLGWDAQGQIMEAAPGDATGSAPNVPRFAMSEDRHLQTTEAGA